ncbi:MAG: imidazole glycerol phosphate synthase subunit HisH [Woeseia sp.]|nr:imidazole glycerol phosphate synthase subunit HisH [Woeseia sp.]MBT8097448.1 imidazole glycerol phosphate synthase subunit HisH [Woeseia sp.]NNE59422.1 imidazole glycerol phosphate synthase subunit HisH [Woeseia sp.]NNL53530.1 imidazole glycerol phosphate synthase subunit HisH [Woeseia sp.]
MGIDVAIADSGGANIASLVFALERLGCNAVLTDDPNTIVNAERVILPGVGAAADAMRRLRSNGLADVIPTLSQPVLGICLGMQLLGEYSAEDLTPCLGVMPLQAERLPASVQQPVPNMGWCRIHKTTDHHLLQGIPDGSFFYFVHSYAFPPNPLSLANATHAREFCAVAAKGNFLAAQFHPERSQAVGSQLLKNFLSLQQ